MRTDRRSANPQQRLRLTIDCLPLHTRIAMLDGVQAAQRLIVGAYTDEHGGMCPMLAAHRCGGRTDFLSFAKAWDRFTNARRPRAASRRERAVLIAALQASIDADADLASAIDQHRALLARRRRERALRAPQIVVRRLRRRRAASVTAGRPDA